MVLLLFLSHYFTFPVLLFTTLCVTSSFQARLLLTIQRQQQLRSAAHWPSKPRIGPPLPPPPFAVRRAVDRGGTGASAIPDCCWHLRGERHSTELRVVVQLPFRSGVWFESGVCAASPSPSRTARSLGKWPSTHWCCADVGECHGKMTEDGPQRTIERGKKRFRKSFLFCCRYYKRKISSLLITNLTSSNAYKTSFCKSEANHGQFFKGKRNKIVKRQQRRQAQQARNKRKTAPKAFVKVDQLNNQTFLHCWNHFNYNSKFFLRLVIWTHKLPSIWWDAERKHLNYSNSNFKSHSKSFIFNSISWQQ